MTTIADKLTAIAEAKEAIKVAIEAKGVEVAEAPLSQYPAKIESIQAGGGGKKLRPRQLSFNGYPDTDIDFSLIDYSLLTSLSYFLAYTNYEELELRDIDAPVATSINGMFNTMQSLRKLTLININVPEASSSAEILNNSRAVEQLLFQNCNFGAVTLTLNRVASSSTPGKIQTVLLDNVICGELALSSAFAYCTALSSFKVVNSNLASSSVSGAFEQCRALEEVDISGVDLSEVRNANRFFYGCKNLKTIRWGIFIGANCTSIKEMFYNCSSLEEFAFPDNLPALTNIFQLFYNCTSIKKIDLAKLDTSNITEASGAFSLCNALTEIIGIEDIDVSKMTLLPSFYYCSSLTNLDLHKWQPVSATNIDSLFQDCYKLTSLNLNGWSFPAATTANSTFSMCGASSQGTLDLNIDGWDFAGITSMSQTFYNCGVQSLKIKRSSADKNLNMSATIYNCIYLITLDMSEFTLENVSISSFLKGCSNIENLKINVVASLYLGEQTKLTHDSLMYIINNAKDLAGGTTQTLTLGSTNLAKLTDDEKAIIIAKNWTLA